ncbi:Uncharacterised protein [Bordetella pertussis]|nr:Uncharacterised protein [Bordetella pertussis]CFP60026.1 Uncharacterised protein [Bordetella pertussis]CFW41059.1 Uncharacterised protein [Bordetella pertussis]
MSTVPPASMSKVPAPVSPTISSPPTTQCGDVIGPFDT